MIRMKWIMVFGFALLAGGTLVAYAGRDTERDAARMEACAEMAAAGAIAPDATKKCRSDDHIFREAAYRIVEGELPRSFREINLAILRFDADQASRDWRGARRISIDAFSRAHSQFPFGDAGANAGLDHTVLEVSNATIMMKDPEEDHGTLFFDDVGPESYQMLPLASRLENRLNQAEAKVALGAICLAVQDTNGGCKARVLIRLESDPVFQKKVPVASEMQFLPLKRSQIRTFLRMTYTPRFSADSRELDIYKMRNLAQIARSHRPKS